MSRSIISTSTASACFFGIAWLSPNRFAQRFNVMAA
jgi:hypothetical protein